MNDYIEQEGGEHPRRSGIPIFKPDNDRQIGTSLDIIHPRFGDFNGDIEVGDLGTARFKFEDTDPKKWKGLPQADPNTPVFFIDDKGEIQTGTYGKLAKKGVFKVSLDFRKRIPSYPDRTQNVRIENLVWTELTGERPTPEGQELSAILEMEPFGAARDYRQHEIQGSYSDYEAKKWSIGEKTGTLLIPHNEPLWYGLRTSFRIEQPMPGGDVN